MSVQSGKQVVQPNNSSGAGQSTASSSTQASQEQSFQISAPTISLPKGGGAIRGMGEKFAANPVTGTGSMTVPLPISPGRGGFQPQLSLSYDSGAGNGPFGLGWRLSLPSISRKTDKGLPRYRDRDESDVFLLAGAEDLVPVPYEGRNRSPGSPIVRLAGQRYEIRRYQPRIEGLFARIERWSSLASPGESFWRVLDRSNVTQWYGRTSESRIADPEDPTRIFEWLPCEQYDDKGNVIIYQYKTDDAEAIDVSKPWESHRHVNQRHAQRYLKRVRYGNRTPYLPSLHPDAPAEPLPVEWLFELVFDYGDYNEANPTSVPDRIWTARPDPFSNYRPGFEVRTSRRCQRVLMFHHIPESPDLGPTGLVRSMRVRYGEGATDNPSQPGYSTLRAIETWAYQHRGDGTLEQRQTPPLEFVYSEAKIDSEIRTLAADALEGLPVGTQGPGTQWIDLDGEGLSGVLSEEAGTWRYASNLGEGRFAPSRVVAPVPASRSLASGIQRLMDVDGNGHLELVAFDGPMPGWYEREAEGEQGDWAPFIPFATLPQIRWDDPNLRFVDLTGDGHADALITEDEVLTWYPSLAERGFDAAERVSPPLGEEGIRLVFADGTQTLFLADMCGDGLTDLVRIRNGDVCYWPNLGYGRFGGKVRLGNAPRFDYEDLFDPRRIRLADVDGSGPTDVLYLGRQGVQIYTNRSGNLLSDARVIDFPLATFNVDAVQVADLLGRGTACLVWNSHLPADRERPVRYIDLMGGTKPHLLIHVQNNLGGKTEIEYTPSTHFYLADKAAGTPWITRLPFPVYCVSKVTVHDQWRGTAFGSTYSYHHGYFDGIEREFRGFGRVEQIDVEDYGRFEQANAGSPWITDDKTLYQPPIKTVTWFHTGLAIDRTRVLSHFAAEYFPSRYRLTGRFREQALPEPVLDDNLSAEEWREALRACKGMALRQEIYELDVEDLTDAAPKHTPVRLYSAATHNCRIQRLHPRGTNRHAVFLVTESEALTYHYELPLPAPGGTVMPDPRISHQLTLRVDQYGQPVQTVAVGYPRVGPVAADGLDDNTQRRIREVQTERHVAYAETLLTGDLVTYTTDDPEAAVRYSRLRLPYEARTFELTGIAQSEGNYYQLQDFAAFRMSDFYPAMDWMATEVAVPQLQYHERPHGGGPQRRLVEAQRTVYFNDGDDTRAPQSPLPLGWLGPRGLTYEAYKLALTRDLLAAIFQKPSNVADEPNDLLAWELHPGVTVRNLLSDPQRSGYHIEEATGTYWIRSGIAGFANDAAQHFFLPERYTDPFGATTTLKYDPLDLYVQNVTDARQNRTEVLRFDHRVLMPVEMVDPNGNHTEACVDILGQVIAVAAKGKKIGEAWEGDDLEAFKADFLLRNPSTADVQAFSTALTLDEAQARRWLSHASSRFVYHFGEIRAENGTVTAWATRPAMACGIAREVHASQSSGEMSPLQVALECSDGSSNVLMKKAQAEPDPTLPQDQQNLRWIVNGLTVLNNKGKPVKQYEPFFSEHFGCEMPREEGVTPILYYDAAGRVVRTDAPDGTFSRVEFSPWHRLQFDANDTVLESRWYSERNPVPSDRPLPRDPINHKLTDTPDQRAAWLAAKVANTPGRTYLDSLGREVIAIAHQRKPDDTTTPTGEWSIAERSWTDEYYITFTKLDAEGKPLWIQDARGNIVMRYTVPSTSGSDPLVEFYPTYDIAGNLLFQHSMDAGDRWSLNDAAGKPFLAWDVNDVLDADGKPNLEARLAHTDYDQLHRPAKQWLRLGRNSAAVVERFNYRDMADADLDLDHARARNLIGQAIIHEDPSGRMELRRRSFTGQVQHEERRLARHSTNWVIDWQGSDGEREVKLETETFTRLTEHDALGRMTQLINWHRPGKPVAVYRPVYNARGLLVSEDLFTRATKTATGYEGGKQTTAVHSITYNAKGQRTRLKHGNGTETLYAYDPRTFRLTQLRTTRPATDLPFPGFRSNLSDERVVQQFHYTYDAAGNIAEIEDEAWKPVFFNNAEVEPRSRYVYDALNRLIEATGRESAQLGSRPPGPVSESFQVENFPADHELRQYRQLYDYDSVGNFLAMRHIANGERWTREYETAADSNRLLRTWTGGDEVKSVRYAYDLHGSMLNLENVSESSRIRWDWRDMIERMDLIGGGQAWYVYDTGKQRTRKRIERQGGDVEERLYLGGMELYRGFAPDGTIVEEIETHHLFVDDQRVLLVDDVIETDNERLGKGVLLRYQYGNHLGSVALELDETAQIIGCEELHPYGTTALHLVNRAVRATSKRYRYTEMERDEETGLNYNSKRYLIVSLGQWISADPDGILHGVDLYSYSNRSPTNLFDRSGTQAVSPDQAGQPIRVENYTEEESVEDMRRAEEIDRVIIAAATRDAEYDAQHTAAQRASPLDFLFFLVTSSDHLRFGEAVTSMELYRTTYDSVYAQQYEIWSAAYTIAIGVREVSEAVEGAVNQDVDVGEAEIPTGPISRTPRRGGGSSAAAEPEGGATPRTRRATLPGLGPGPDDPAGGGGGGGSSGGGPSGGPPSRTGGTLPGVGPGPDDPAHSRTYLDPRTRRTLPGLGSESSAASPPTETPALAPSTPSTSTTVPLSAEARDRILRFLSHGETLGVARANPTEFVVYESLWREYGGVGPPPPHGFIVRNPDGTNRLLVMNRSTSPSGTGGLHAPFH